MNITTTTITSILLLVLALNPALVALGQEETPTEESTEETTTEGEETTTDVSEEVSMGEEEATAEEEMTDEETTNEELADDTMVMTKIKSPKKQMAEGVEASAVVCNEGLNLIIKTSTGSAACVKSSSVETLIARGWGTTPA